MSLKIRYRTFTDTRVLEVKPEGLVFIAAAAFSKARTFRYDEILCVLLSPENVLSFQVGADVFSLPVTPENGDHRAVIEALLARLQRPTPPEYASQSEPPASTPPPDSCPTSNYEY